ncbi:hypothetical protein GPA10_11940 [Streptomyces sp. p1417]|uniref:Uncharacterized protein n=1 Tax=Streptomyces typhae TaxID=2681492 RepID=A0A6L6WW05_9ACTN|nr:hypothetical protein [Streptomyces typhae]MVO85444.1 hypothetical protein [Streptomyces typhae]
MDASAAGAARLMAALNEAVRDFQSYGYEQLLTHQGGVSPRYGGTLTPAVHPTAVVGVTFGLRGGPRSGEGREASISVSVALRDEMFVVEGEAGADPLHPGEADEPWEYLRELPEVGVWDLDECIALIRDYTAQLCAYTGFLDDLGVPRTS